MRQAVDGASAARPASPLLRAASALRGAVEAVGRLMGLAAGWVFILCALFITADVVARNVLRVSSQSTTEITGYMLALGLAWGLGHALTTRSHVRIDLLVNRLPAGPRRWLHLVSLALLSVFAFFIAWGAVELVRESWLFGATDVSLLRTPLVIPQGLWALGLCAFFVLVMLLLAEGVLLMLAGGGEEVERRLGSRGYDEEVTEALEAAALAKGDGR